MNRANATAVGRSRFAGCAGRGCVLARRHGLLIVLSSMKRSRAAGRGEAAIAIRRSQRADGRAVASSTSATDATSSRGRADAAGSAIRSPASAAMLDESRRSESPSVSPSTTARPSGARRGRREPASGDSPAILRADASTTSADARLASERRRRLRRIAAASVDETAPRRGRRCGRRRGTRIWPCEAASVWRRVAATWRPKLHTIGEVAWICWRRELTHCGSGFDS